MSRPSQRKTGQKRKSRPKRARIRSKKHALSRAGKIGTATFAILPNTHDYFAVEMLRNAPVGGLAVDELITGAPKETLTLRDALCTVYFDAARRRSLGKATKNQLKNAKSALSRLAQALENLEAISTDGRTGLRMLLEGLPLDDNKGERELNEFALACWTIRMDVGQIGVALRTAIENEEHKQTRPGERRKRLRTLVDALADWWQSAGAPLTVIVDANRRDDGPAVVHGRRGCFLALARALFSEVDKFNQSEVEAAVTNVHEERLARAKTHAPG